MKKNGVEVVSIIDTPLVIIDKLIYQIEEQEGLFFQEYKDALNIENQDDMLKEQHRTTFCIRPLKMWNSQLIQIRKEMVATGIFTPISEESAEKITMTVDSVGKHSEIKIGKYVQERMRLLENANLKFTNDEIVQVMDKGWSKNVLYLSKAFMIPFDSTKSLHSQIADEGGNNRYWKDPFCYNDRKVFICSQWYCQNKVNFDAWISPLAKRAGITFPERTVCIDSQENKRQVSIKKPIVLEKERKTGEYIEKCLRALEAKEISFQQSYLDLMLTKEWAKVNLSLEYAFLIVVDQSQNAQAQIADKNGINRYWEKSYTFGAVNVFVCSEWDVDNQRLFENWLNDVPEHTNKNTVEASIDTVSDDIIKLIITEYKMKKR